MTLPRILGPALLLALLLAAASAQAPREEPWSVQTVALRDFGEASATAAELVGLGFDAYTEFTMRDGRQWVRVRVGCWLGRDAADGIAEILRGLVTAEAVAVPLSPGAGVPCVRVDVGFIKPARYLALHLSGELPTYRVDVAGHVAHVRHDGERWGVHQGDGEPAPEAAPATGTVLRAGEVRGFAVVLRESAGGATVLCPGRLVAQVADVAVVEWANAIVACSLEDDR